MSHLDVGDLFELSLIAGLFNRAKPSTPAEMFDPRVMGLDEAAKLWEGMANSGQTLIDSIEGRTIGLDLRSGKIDTALYDLVNGKDAAKTVVDALKAGVQPPIWNYGMFSTDEFSEYPLHRALARGGPQPTSSRQAYLF